MLGTPGLLHLGTNMRVPWSTRPHVLVKSSSAPALTSENSPTAGSHWSMPMLYLCLTGEWGQVTMGPACQHRTVYRPGVPSIWGLVGF